MVRQAFDEAQSLIKIINSKATSRMDGEGTDLTRMESLMGRFQTVNAVEDIDKAMSELARRGSYVSPHAGKVLFGDHAGRWMNSWNTEFTTAAG